MRKTFFSKISTILILAIFTFLLYFNSFGNAFIWDDVELVVNNPFVQETKNIIPAFSSGLFPQDIQPGNFYRPLQTISFIIDHFFWKTNPLGYHLTNTLLHLFCAILLYYLALGITHKKSIAFIASLLFLSHPIQTEAITYISGRADPLSALFCLASLLLYIRYSAHQKKPLFYLLSLTAFFLALLSKETALIFPLLIILYDWLNLKKFSLKKTALRYFGYLCVIFLYLILYKTALKDVGVHSTLISQLNFFQRILTFAYAFVNYLGLLLIPLNLHMERLISPVTGILDIRFLVSLAMIILLAVIAFRRAKGSKPLLFALLWFVLTLIPVSNIFFRLNALMAEHWLYLPSMGFFLATSITIHRISQNKTLKPIMIALVIALISLYSVLTIRQNQIWKDPITFFQYTLKFSPQRSRLHNNLGIAYQEKKLFDQAIKEFQAAIKINPGDAATFTNLGNAYQETGELDAAIAAYKKAIGLNHAFLSAYNNLGNAYFKKGEFPKAINIYTQALDLNLKDYQLWNNLADAYRSAEDYPKAIEAYNKTISINPTLYNAYLNLGAIYLSQGDIDAAVSNFREAINLNPGSYEAYFNLGLAYVKWNRADLAKDAWLKAITLNPGLIQAQEGIKKLEAQGF